MLARETNGGGWICGLVVVVRREDEDEDKLWWLDVFANDKVRFNRSKL